MIMENLTNEQHDQVLRFLLHRMPTDTRHELMRALPLAYAALHPAAAPAVIAMVRDALSEVADNAREFNAAIAGGARMRITVPDL
jgi:hypothetical protein